MVGVARSCCPLLMIDTCCFSFLISMCNVVTINVNSSGNDLPVATNDFESTDEDTPVNIHVLTNDSDPDSDPLTNAGVVSGLGPISGAVTLNADGETFDYTPNSNYHGQDSFVYKISDGNGGSATATGAFLLDGLSMSFDGSLLFCTYMNAVLFSLSYPKCSYHQCECGQ